MEAEPLGGGEGVLEAVEPRRNEFRRPAAANIDQMVIVAANADPVTDPYLIDRTASLAALQGCGAIVCINKCDLDPAKELYRIYAASALPTVLVSAETGEGLEELKTMIAGKLSAFTGDSGVGKSSILNALEPGFHLRVGEVSDALHRGRHTTRHVELYRLSCGAEVIDTPGFSSFDCAELSLLWKRRLPETFPEFLPCLDGCRYAGCSHTKERGCAVRGAVAAGEIPESRYASYCRLYEELKPLKEWEQTRDDR